MIKGHKIGIRWVYLLGPYNTSDYPINIVVIPLIYIVFPPSSTFKLLRIPHGVYVLPSNAFNVVEDRDKVGDPKVFQQLIDIIHVDAPSSIIVR